MIAATLCFSSEVMALVLGGEYRAVPMRGGLSREETSLVGDLIRRPSGLKA